MKDEGALGREILEFAKAMAKLQATIAGVREVHTQIQDIMDAHEKMKDANFTIQKLAARIKISNNLLSSVAKIYDNARIGLIGAIDGYEQEVKDA